MPGFGGMEKGKRHALENPVIDQTVKARGSE
jgi:hypothetical protein